MASVQERDPWSSDAYQKAAGFVPRLATKIVGWLDVQPTDFILDIGCGDGVLSCQIAETLTSGHVIGIDSSPRMIQSALETVQRARPLCYMDFLCFDARDLVPREGEEPKFTNFDKVFSNAALHWILREEAFRDDVFRGVYDALLGGGAFVFEMGGRDNVREMRAALVDAVAKRVGPEAARQSDPWFFPDIEWMKASLERQGFVVERLELELRPTDVEEGEGGGIDGWVRLMGSNFFDAVGEDGSDAREDCIMEVVERLENECKNPHGGYIIEYVRLRGLARKPM